MHATAQRYRAAGLSVLPAKLKEKRPGCGSWKRYQDRLPTEAEIDAWWKRPRDALCLITGAVSGNLELIDFDHVAEAFAEWAGRVPLELLGRLFIETSQSGGKHVVYRCEEEVGGNQKLAIRPGENCKLVCLIETRGNGGLFLCAPTPGYTVEAGSLEDLPVLTKAERDLLIDAAKACGTDGHRKALDSSPGFQGLESSITTRPGDDYNERASFPDLLIRHGWTPQHTAADGNENWTRPGKTTGTSATLKDGKLYIFSTSCDPLEAERTYSAFGFYVALEHQGDFAAATRQLGRDGYGGNGTAPQVDISALLPVADDKPTAIVEPIDPGPFPPDLLEPPGLISDIAAHIDATNHTRQPALSIGAALTLVGLIAGRKIRDTSGARSNIAALGVAETCCGKERARGVAKEVLSACGREKMFFERPASYQGLQRRMLRQPAGIMLWDEMGQCFKAIKGANNSPHLSGIMRTMTELITSAGSIYCSDSHADDTHDFTIDQPCLCVYGTSTPGELFDGLTPESITNGFCGRMMLFEGSAQPDDVEGIDETEIPAGIIEACKKWLDFVPKNNDMNLEHPRPEVVPHTPEALEVLAALRDVQRKARASSCPNHKALWGRSVQKASQVALAVAASKYGPDMTKIKIDVECAEYAVRLIEHVHARLLCLASSWISSSPFHNRCNQVVRFIDDKGGECRSSDISRHFHRWKRKERDEILENIVATERVTTGPGPKTGRGVWYFTK